MQIPARYAIRQYLRDQLRLIEKLTSDRFLPMRAAWRQAYQSRPLSSTRLRDMADEFRSFAESIGGFDFDLEHVPATRAAPFREKVRVVCQIVDPVSLHQGWEHDDELGYREPVAMLRRFEAEFRPKQGHVSFTPNFVALSRHTLERIYERTEVSHDVFRGRLHGSLTSLMDALALSMLCEIFDFYEGEEVGSVYRAIPYENGLLLLNSRILVDRADAPSIGFRMTLQDGNMRLPLINAEHDFSRVTSEWPRHMTGISLNCSLTYMNLLDLRGGRVDYYYSFCDLLDQLSPDERTSIRRAVFTPRPRHQGPPQLSFSGEFERKVNRTIMLLREGWLSKEVKNAFCSIEPYEP